MPDEIQISVLADGTIKTVTDPVSAPNHQNAEGFLETMAKMAGGTPKRVRKKGSAHTHKSGETHSH